MTTIQFKRGNETTLPTLSSGEPAVTLDTQKVFVGTPGGNVQLAKQSDLDTMVKKVNGVTPDVNGNVVISGSGNSALIYNTVTDLQTAYPSGTTQPAWVVADNAWYYWSSVIVTPDTTAPTVSINVVGGTYTSAQSITLTGSDDSGVNPTIYYTLDGSTPTTSSTVYSSPIAISANTTLKYFAKDGSGNTSSVVTQTYTMNIGVADTTPPTVTASVAGGTYTSSQAVTLSATDNSGGAVSIYYTTNGTTPTTASTLYTTPISISATTTLQFIGKDAAGNVSTPVAATYTINAATSWVTSGLVNKWDNLTNKVSFTDTNSQYFQPTADFTICATFEPKAYANIMSQYVIGNPDSYRFYVGDSGDKVYGDFWGTNNGTAVYPQMRPTTALSSPTTYYHVAIVRSGGSFKIYINNVHDTTGDLNYGTFVATTSTQPISVAENSSNYKTVVYYNRALSDAELTQNYTALS